MRPALRDRSLQPWAPPIPPGPRDCGHLQRGPARFPLLSPLPVLSVLDSGLASSPAAAILGGSDRSGPHGRACAAGGVCRPAAPGEFFLFLLPQCRTGPRWLREHLRAPALRNPFPRPWEHGCCGRPSPEGTGAGTVTGFLSCLRKNLPP